MGKFKIEFSKSAAKSYKNLPKDYKSLVDMALNKLSNNISGDIKPIKGEKDIYRLRIGKYRLLFTILEDTIIVTKIGPRGDIYKN